MRPQLYMCGVCPCARAVVLTAKVLELTLQIKEITNEGQFCNNKFIQQHCNIPILKDCGCVIWDSHAIIAYLVGKYGKDDSLYPSDVQKRSVIDQRLEFDSSVMTFMTRSLLTSITYDDNATAINEIYRVCESFFENGCQWIAGDELSIADLSNYASITSLDVVVPIDKKKFPKISRWLKKAEQMPFYQVNKEGLCNFRAQLCCK